MAENRPPEVKNVTEYPELGETRKPYVPARHLNTDYPVRFWPALTTIVQGNAR